VRVGYRLATLMLARELVKRPGSGSPVTMVGRFAWWHGGIVRATVLA
jgi:hypothetical protein